MTSEWLNDIGAYRHCFVSGFSPENPKTNAACEVYIRKGNEMNAAINSALARASGGGLFLSTF